MRGTPEPETSNRPGLASPSGCAKLLGMASDRFWSGLGTFTIGLGLGTLIALPVFLSTIQRPAPSQDLSTIEPGVSSSLPPHPIESPHPGQPVFLRVFKAERILELWQQGEAGWTLRGRFPLLAMPGTLGPKQTEGDRQAPEGFYFITPSPAKADDRWRRSMKLNFPNPHDQARGWTGSFLLIHNSDAPENGFAVEDEVAERLFDLVEQALKQGQPSVPVHIFPFAFTEDNWKRFGQSPWAGFWRTLEPAYHWFENEQILPTVSVEQSSYRLERGD